MGAVFDSSKIPAGKNVFAAGHQRGGASVLLGNLSEGSIVTLNEDGRPVEFYVAKQDYEPDLNGSGRVLVARKECFGTKISWSLLGGNYYTSAADTWCNNTYYLLFTESVRSIIASTRFRAARIINNKVEIISRGAFLLSATELGGLVGYEAIDGSKLPIANLLAAAEQWTRTSCSLDSDAYSFNADGTKTQTSKRKYLSARPAFTLPADVLVAADGSIIV